MINYSFAEVISKALHLSHVPSAFQIRFGGCKGMLVVQKGCERKVLFTKSMMKFHSSDNTLEILSYSSKKNCFFNRQIFLVLIILNVPFSVFDEKSESGYIYRMLKALDGSSSFKELFSLCTNDITKNFSYFIEKNVFGEEMFFKCLKKQFAEYLIRELQSKQRILNLDGVVVVGCADFSGKLKEGEIFVAVSSGKFNEERTVFKDKCLVTRSPTHKATDIRLLTAVDYPEFNHLKDVILFSTQGKVPESFKMSQGDLDGDLYWIWNLKGQNKEWVDSLKIEEPVFNYSKKEKVHKGVFTVKEMSKFVVEFFEKYNLPELSNLHLYHSNALETGVNSNVCMDLASRCSQANDYVKSGNSSIIYKRDLPKNGIIERGLQNSLFSGNTPIGKIFFGCRSLKSSLDIEKENLSTVSLVEKFVNKNKVSWEIHKDLVCPVFLEYKSLFLSIIQKYELEDEFELFFSKQHAHFNIKLRTFLMSKITNFRRRIFLDTDDVDVTIQKLCCCYFVSKGDSKNSRGDKMAVSSFSWLVGCKLWKEIKM